MPVSTPLLRRLAAFIWPPASASAGFPARTYAEELEHQCRRFAPLLSSLAVLAWLPYLPIDARLHPELPQLPWLRWGATFSGVVGWLVLTLGPPRYRAPLVIFIEAYFLLATASLTGLTGADPSYVGGYCLIILSSMLGNPVPVRVHYLLLTVSLAIYFGTCFWVGVDFSRSTVRYGLNDVGAAVGVAVIFTWVLDGIRYRSYRLGQQLAAQQQAAERVVNDLKQTQTQLVQQEKMASLGQLTAGLAHEINNPINFIWAGANSLAKNLVAYRRIVAQYETITDSTDVSERLAAVQALKVQYNFSELEKDLDELVAAIQLGAERTNAIVQSLRQFSRTNDGGLSQANLHTELEATLTLLQHHFRDGISLVKDYDLKLPPVLAYHSLLNQVFMNLIQNAVQAIEKDGTVTVITRRISDRVEVCIRDTGRGIPDSVRSRIFDPFFTTKAPGKGTGLGLAIAYGIVGKHGGRLDFRSEVGKGSEFIITLPHHE